MGEGEIRRLVEIPGAILELVDSDSARLEEAFVTLAKAPDFDARAEKGSAQHFQVAVVAVIESRREFFPELFQACATSATPSAFSTPSTWP